jgi:outer membrane lipoprotein-sorting protein
MAQNHPVRPWPVGGRFECAIRNSHKLSPDRRVPYWQTMNFSLKYPYEKVRRSNRSIVACKKEEHVKKSFAWILGIALVVSFTVQAGYGQTAQEVLKKLIDASGGRKAMTAIKDVTMSGTYEITQFGMSGTITMYQKEPNKMRVDMDIPAMGMVMTQAYDGQKAMYTNPQSGGAVEEMPESMSQEFAREALGNDALLNPEKYKITYEVKPKAKLDSKEYIVLEQTMSDGHKATIYIDPATYLPYKTETTAIGQNGAEVKAESYPSDYKPVNGVMMAHSIRTLQDGTEFMKMTFTKITVNNNLEDSLFTLGKK